MPLLFSLAYQIGREVREHLWATQIFFFKFISRGP